MQFAENTEPTETTYKCRQCGAIDSDRGVYPPAPQLLQCMSCGAGSGLDITTQAHRSVGMFPITPEEAVIERQKLAGR